MEPYIIDNSGIYSLSGFSYQIRVFVYYLSELEEGMQIEFETIDDVNMKKMKAQQLDEFEEEFKNKIVGSTTNITMQVKRTTITQNSAMKVLLNWILLESSEHEVSKYTLFTDSVYNNKDILFNDSAETIFESIKNSKKTSKATVTKVKNKYKEIEEFKNVYNSIQSKYEFVSMEDIDSAIDRNCAGLFRKAGISKVVYFQRIKELLQHITVQIMDSIHSQKPYVLTYQSFMALVEEICSRMTEKITLPQYSDFKKLHSIDFNDLSISKSREYKQLLACELPQHIIKTHLGYGEYYKELRFKYMELNRISNIENIEEMTHENFEMVKLELQKNKSDTPYNRLNETKKQGNTYAQNEHVRFGSGIFLTKEGIEEIQISWEDDSDETITN
ncbi:hypothetical protein E2R58_12905 [Paenibacillus amylolyticus]|uniref:hypothetical protein n=1 Tax=Paenibacillus amylolyticus TaxID=1451 RepID=UPI00105A0250|nr:hypothetical protein [Paenibacillus amylolyticus]TDL70017.1 hypothetical protein E2R58_12905 [Paenibacillus amylolyticus]